MSDEQPAGTPDVVYNLVSVIYHALQGAETYHEYIKDAEQKNDSDAADLFREARQQNQRIADQAERLLAKRLGK